MSDTQSEDLASIHETLTRALVSLGMKVGADDPDFERACAALDRLHDHLSRLQPADGTR